MLWDATLTNRQIDIDATADQLIDVLWVALTPPDLALGALQRFRVEVAAASRRFDEASAAASEGKAEATGPASAARREKSG